MRQDEIIAMGNEAALQHGHTYEPEPGDGTIEFLGSFAALVAEKAAEKEREASTLLSMARTVYSVRIVMSFSRARCRRGGALDFVCMALLHVSF